MISFKNHFFLTKKLINIFLILYTKITMQTQMQTQTLNQNILATIVAITNDPTQLTMTNTIFKYQFIYYTSPLCINKNEIFWKACRNNKDDIIRVLLHHVSQSDIESQITHACLYKSIENLKLLFSNTNRKISCPISALYLAIYSGNYDIVKYLIEEGKVDPSLPNNQAIINASSDGSVNIVRLLLEDKRVDPSAQNNDAIKWAKNHGHHQVVSVLLEDERVSSTYISQE